MLRFLLELVPSLLIGFWAGRRHETLSTRLASPLVRFGVPISGDGPAAQGWPQWRHAAGRGSGMAGHGPCLAGASRLPGCAALASPTMRLGSCTGNTAYFGVPLALAFLPADALPISIGYDLGATLLTWSLGPLLIGAQATGAQQLRGLLISVVESPATRGLIGALLVQATPWAALVTDALWAFAAGDPAGPDGGGHALGQHPPQRNHSGGTSIAAAQAIGGQTFVLSVAPTAACVTAEVRAANGPGGCPARGSTDGHLPSVDRGISWV